MSKIYKGLLIVSLMLLSACAYVMPEETEPQVQKIADKILLASGYSQTPKQPQLTIQQNRFSAEQSAKIDAYRVLAKLLYSEQLANGFLVADQVIKDEAFRIYTDLFLRGAEVVSYQQIGQQKKVLLRLSLTPRFYQCISLTVEVVSQCVKDDGKFLFTRIGTKQAKMETVNVSCPDCTIPLSVAGFSNEKMVIDQVMLDFGLYDTQWTVNMAVTAMLNYMYLTGFVFQ